MNVKFVRIKQKIEKKNRIKSGAGKLFTDAVVEEVATTEKVVRSKTIDLEPMDLDEAILQNGSIESHDSSFIEAAHENAQRHRQSSCHGRRTG